MTDRIRILIADDHPIVRQGLQVLLESQPDLELIAQAENGEKAVRLANKLQPDVIVMDLQMPVKDGLTAVDEILRAYASIQILVLTSFPDDAKVLEAVKVGATGVILKDSPPDQLLAAIRTVYAGGSALHPTVARRLVQEIQQPHQRQPALDALTPREQDILKCLAQGMSNREIAGSLDISVRTVTTHVRNILDKLELDNRTQAALYAVKNGLISAP